jgi:DNA-binding response OmpR family regulator
MSTEAFSHGVIVADDSAQIRDNVRSALGPPWHVFMAANGIEAVQYASSIHAVLVLLDVSMPRMDGLDACARIRTMPHYETTPIVMLTAYDDEDMRRRARFAGATTLFRKPFTIDSLRAGLAPFLDASLDAVSRHQTAQSRDSAQPGRTSLSSDGLTRDQRALKVTRQAEASVVSRSYINVAAAALRELSKR